MQRRGSLSTSTNAIVVLIVAIIALGLIIGLVTSSFSLVESRFIEQIEANEPDPIAPTIQNPISLSADAKAAGRGEQMGLKINVLNKVGTNITVAPVLSCSSDKDLGNDGLIDEAADSEVYNPETVQAGNTTIQANQFEQFTMIFAIHDDAPVQKHLCQIEAKCQTLDSASRDCTADLGRTEFQVVVKG